MRFTYTTDIIGGQPVTIIKETAGVFSGYTPEQVAIVAENLYPNYQSRNMSNVFSDIYFNYCLRKTLEGQPIPNEYLSNNIRQTVNDSDLHEEID